MCETRGRGGNMISCHLCCALTGSLCFARVIRKAYCQLGCDKRLAWLQAQNVPHPHLHAGGPLGMGAAGSSSREDLIEERLRHELHQTQAGSSSAPPEAHLQSHRCVGTTVLPQIISLHPTLSVIPFRVSTHLFVCDRQSSTKKFTAPVLCESAQCSWGMLDIDG